MRPRKVWYSAFGSTVFSICFKGGGQYLDSVASIFPLGDHSTEQNPFTRNGQSQEDEKKGTKITWN